MSMPKRHPPRAPQFPVPICSIYTPLAPVKFLCEARPGGPPDVHPRRRPSFGPCTRGWTPPRSSSCIGPIRVFVRVSHLGVFSRIWVGSGPQLVDVSGQTQGWSSVGQRVGLVCNLVGHSNARASVGHVPLRRHDAAEVERVRVLRRARPIMATHRVSPLVLRPRLCLGPYVWRSDLWKGTEDATEGVLKRGGIKQMPSYLLTPASLSTPPSPFGARILGLPPSVRRTKILGRRGGEPS